MTISIKLPDVDSWKAQVKCQTACPVDTDAGRYVQLIAEGRDEEAFLVARAPNPFVRFADASAPRLARTRAAVARSMARSRFARSNALSPSSTVSSRDGRMRRIGCARSSSLAGRRGRQNSRNGGSRVNETRTDTLKFEGAAIFAVYVFCLVQNVRHEPGTAHKKRNIHEPLAADRLYRDSRNAAKYPMR